MSHAPLQQKSTTSDYNLCVKCTVSLAKYLEHHYFYVRPVLESKDNVMQGPTKMGGWTRGSVLAYSDTWCALWRWPLTLVCLLADLPLTVQLALPVSAPRTFPHLLAITTISFRRM